MNNSHGARRRAAALACKPSRQEGLRPAGRRTSPYVACIDFDGTLLNHDDVPEGYRMGNPFEGAAEVLNQLKEAGARIVVLTCRARPRETLDGITWDGNTEHVAQWLKNHGIPFDEITALKPLADVYVDDRAIRFEGSWEDIAPELLAGVKQK